MCIIISKPKGVILDKDVYRECFIRNADGAGIAYVDKENHKLKVEKGFFSFKAFYKALRAVEEEDVLIHFRIQTHGGVSKANCHPFGMQSANFKQYSFAMAHNGRLSYQSSANKSDTAHFAEEVLFEQLSRDPWFLDYPAGVFLIESFLGKTNKMVVFRYDSAKDKLTTYILNPELGFEDMKCWFSNASYKPLPPAVHCGYYGREWDRDYDAEERAWVDSLAKEYGWTRDSSGNWRHPATVPQHHNAYRPPALPPPPVVPPATENKGTGQAVIKFPDQKKTVMPQSGIVANLMGEEIDPNDTTLMALISSGRDVDSKDSRNVSLAHLKDKELAALRMAYAVYFGQIGLKSAIQWGAIAQRNWVHEDIRSNNDTLKTMNDVVLDKLLLSKIEEHEREIIELNKGAADAKKEAEAAKT